MKSPRNESLKNLKSQIEYLLLIFVNSSAHTVSLCNISYCHGDLAGPELRDIFVKPTGRQG